MAKMLQKPFTSGFENIFRDDFVGDAPGHSVAIAAQGIRESDVDFVIDLLSKMKGRGSDHFNGEEDGTGSTDGAGGDGTLDFSFDDAMARGGKSGGGGGSGSAKGGGKPDKTTTDTGGSTGGTDTGGTTGGTDTGGTTGGTDTGGTTTDTSKYYQGADYVSGLDNPNGFNIEIVFSGSWTTELKAAMIQATEFLSDIITGDLPDAIVGSSLIDDVRINATLTAMDGVGGKLGSGGMEAYRSGSYLTTVGRMSFDEADAVNLLSKGLWDDVISHEILHALGFGLTWNALGLVTTVGTDMRFNGDNATLAYNQEFAAIAGADSLSDVGVPIETDGGSGTAGKHWDEATFGSELMTGWISNNAPISTMTIAALEDMGYQTVFDPAAYFIV